MCLKLIKQEKALITPFCSNCLLLSLNFENFLLVVLLSFQFKVYDTLPESIFQPYDVPVDYIVTPTEIIKVQNRPSRPLGIIWNLLSQRKLNLMPILKFLKEKGEE